MYTFLDWFFTLFHILVILFNLFGWLWKPLRPWNLGLLLITGASWFILGIFYGIGYCPLTDWHFRVLEQLGYTSLPNSYISFLFTRISHLHLPDRTVDALTLLAYLLALVISVLLNIRDYMRNRTAKRETRE